MKKILSIALAIMALFCTFGCSRPSPDGNVEALGELKGRVVYSIGQGNVPDLVFRWLLKDAGIEYEFSDSPVENKVALSYVSEGTAIIGGMSAGKIKYGVISEPAATVALGKVENCSRMLDIQKLYKNATGADKGYPQAALVVKNSFLQEHKGYVAAFVEAFKAGAKWAETEPDAALEAIKSKGSTAVAKLNSDIAQNCNLGFTPAQSIKSELLSFYAALNGVTAEGESTPVPKMPEDSFFLGDVSAENESGVTCKVYAPDGAPAISLAKMMHDGFTGAEFNVVVPDTIGAEVLTNADIAVMPTNAAAKLSAAAGISMLGVTNFGSLYVIGINSEE